MAKFFDQLEAEHIAFIEKQRMFFVATAENGAHPNLSPKGYDTLAVLGPDRVVYVDWPVSKFEDVWDERAPLGWNVSDADPVARTTVALLSDWMPATTGEVIHADGGFHATAV